VFLLPPLLTVELSANPSNNTSIASLIFDDSVFLRRSFIFSVSRLSFIFSSSKGSKQVFKTTTSRLGAHKQNENVKKINDWKKD
jgi:hypothetical protein